jgi:excisionase family DNA binding protein
MKEFLSVEEISDRLDLSQRSVQQLIKSARIPGGVKPGRQWRVRASTFDEWLKSSVVQARPTGMPILLTQRLAGDGSPLSELTKLRLARLQELGRKRSINTQS